MSSPKSRPSLDENEKRQSSGFLATSMRAGLDGLVVSAMKSASGAPMPGVGAKEPLSLQTTGVNFRRFVQKTGPIFAIRDAVEAVIFWENDFKTIFFAIVYGILCFYPRVLIVLPNIVLASILLYNHPSAPVPDHLSNTDLDAEALPPVTQPPNEESVDYFANLTNIQAVMGEVSDLMDFIRLYFPLFLWHEPRHTTLLLQFTTVTGILLFIASPFIPWTLVFLVFGEATLFAGHPICRSLGKDILPFIKESSRAWRDRIERWIDEDNLTEEELGGVVVEVEKFQIENKVDGQFKPELNTGGQLPKDGPNPWGWDWASTQKDWRVDHEGNWAGGNIDSDGWCYLCIDGSRAPTNLPHAMSRKRRLYRKAVNIHTPLGS